LLHQILSLARLPISPPWLLFDSCNSLINNFGTLHLIFHRKTTFNRARHAVRSDEKLTAFLEAEKVPRFAVIIGGMPGVGRHSVW
jgi:hypothetical protein